MALFVLGGLSESILDGVTGVVVGLAAGADNVRGGGEHDEEIEGGGVEGLLEIECAFELGIEWEIEGVERHGVKAAILRDY